jgi:imidazolonepropionase-like amidohydrolase
MLPAKSWSLCISLVFLCASMTASPAESPLVLTHVTVIDGTGASPRSNKTLIIISNRIDAIIDASAGTQIPKGARVIPAAGKFLIPGLWDMHVHLRASDLPVLVAYGVMGVRDMGNILSNVDKWRGEISSGTLTGPQIFRVGPILNGKAFGPVQVEITGESEARAAVRVLKNVGVDAIKTHRALPREAYFALADEAKKRAIPFVGHIPQTITPQEASDAGQASIEHVETLFEGNAPLKREDAPDLFAHFLKNNTTYTPMLVAYRGSTQPANIDPQLLQKYPKLPEGRKKFFSLFCELVAAMNQKGVTLMTGTDLGVKWILPGSSLHDELALLVEAGLSPMQALQSATRNPARFLQLETGTVEPRKAANLVLLDANPLDDIRNTRRIHGVIIRGHFFDRESLDRLLLEAEQATRVE